MRATEDRSLVPPSSSFQLSLCFRGFWNNNGDLIEPALFLANVDQEIARLKRLGAVLIEFATEVCSRDLRYASVGLWREVATLLRSHGLGATVHLPSTWVDLSSLDPYVWEGSLRSVETAMKSIIPLDPVLAVVHPANYASGALLRNLPQARRERTMATMAARVTEALQRLCHTPLGSMLAVENLEGTPMDLIVRVARDADVGICVDAGHAVSDGEDPTSFVRMAGDRLRGVHLHDAVPSAAARTSGRAHLPLGEGALNLAGFVSTLVEQGFRGPVVLEDSGDSEASAARFLASTTRPGALG